MGHYLTCRHYGIAATLPFFIPAPTLIGTLGAFIKIKSPITRRNQLFDIGVAGPLVGFVLALPALIYGLSLSKVVPAVPREDAMVFGEPLLLKFIVGIIFRGASSQSDLFLHPVAFAGWVGILVTAFNLFPVGQLDGGHVSFALLGEKSKSLARLLLGAFFVMGVFFWVGWIVWALVILLLGLKHPRVVDEGGRLSPARRYVGVLILAVFIVSFIPAPIKGYSLLELLHQWGF
jgi:membrane-associated protease RseP (regulator of RpoE activity)